MKIGSIDKIIRPKDGKEFKIGDEVYWNDLDYNYEDQEYQKQYPSSIFVGNIEDIMVIQYDWDKSDKFSIEVSLTNTKPYDLGRLELNEIEFDPNDLEDVSFYDEDLFDQETVSTD